MESGWESTTGIQRDLPGRHDPQRAARPRVWRSVFALGERAWTPPALPPTPRLAPHPATSELATPATATLDEPARAWWCSLVPSWLASLVVHLVLIVLLALVAQASIRRASLLGESVAATVTGSLVEPAAAALDGETLGHDLAAGEALDAEPAVPRDLASSADVRGEAAPSWDHASALERPAAQLPNDMPALPDDMQALPSRTILKGPWVKRRAPAAASAGGTAGGDELAGAGDNTWDLRALASAAEARLGGALAARTSGAYRAEMLREHGGTPESERAVRLALHWLAEHQLGDGSWSFDLADCRSCRQRCGNSGTLNRFRVASTALALLPFLGAGQTHHDGEYRRQIDRGLYFLQRHMVTTDDGGSLYDEEGHMYGHGLATIVLCEAYGMTRDRTLREPAQQAVRFIVAAQDPAGGGWRYRLRQPGDTSVVGWQLMALRSAELAYLEVPPITWQRADYFLDAVQSDRGSQYGYVSPGAGPATSAIGLLGRMLIGWDADHSALARGVRQLASAGPSLPGAKVPGGMYYNYYATQVLHHVGGPLWEHWNETLRHELVGLQATRGHERGSWYIDSGDHGARVGGRLYSTALAAMTLEVYYRYLPLYGRDSLKPPQRR